MDKNKKMPVIIDCDPGTDDIFAIMMARNIDNFDVRAITAVAGNVTLENTAANALAVTAFVDWDVPVAKGADRPLCCELKTAAEIHGSNGMRGLTLPPTDKQLERELAWDIIYREAKAANGELVVIVLGPFTNVALAVMKYPELKTLIKRIVAMGGTFFSGNTTPASEFNIYVDPEAAEYILQSGIPVYLCPLDVTHKTYITAEEIERIGALGSPQAAFLANVTGLQKLNLNVYTKGRGVALHDPCAVLFASDESIFTYGKCTIGVETQGLITRGKTVCDLWSNIKSGRDNGYVVYDVDREAFIARVMELMSPYR